MTEAGRLEWYGDKFLASTKAAMKAALTMGCQVVETDAVNLCPVGKSRPGYLGGNLRGSITRKVTEEEGRVGTNVDYAPHVEYGTKAHTISVKTARVLSDGKQFFGRTVNHPGTPPKPFLRPALDNNRDKILKAMGEIIGKAAEAGGNK